MHSPSHTNSMEYRNSITRETTAAMGAAVAVYRPGGVGGVPTPPSGINDIHNFNYIIQERPLNCF